MVVIKSQRDLERFARTAESLEINQTTVHGSATYYLTGPKNEDNRIYWPDAVVVTKDLVKTNTLAKLSGNVLRFSFENGDGLYHVLGELPYMQSIVLSKLSCSIEHGKVPPSTVQDPESQCC